MVVIKWSDKCLAALVRCRVMGHELMQPTCVAARMHILMQR